MSVESGTRAKVSQNTFFNVELYTCGKMDCCGLQASDRLMLNEEITMYRFLSYVL